MPISPFELLQHIQIIGTLHSWCPNDDANATRIWDGKTPFFFHPLWCAATILTEQNLDEDIRMHGALVLLYHDIFEDTKGNLPTNLPKDVVNDIRSMTFKKSSSTWEEIRRMLPKFRLYKLYDKTSNLLDPFPQDPTSLRERQKLVKLLIDDVVEHYGVLNIVKIARSLIAGSNI